MEQTGETMQIQCVCGQPVEFPVQKMGHTIRCEHCKRYLRPALQFLLADKDQAPNLAAQCLCGHFIVERPDMAGKRARCNVCKRHLIMPRPVVKFNVPPFVRVSRKALEGQLKRTQERRDRIQQDIGRLKGATAAGRITLGPGQRICVNLSCGALLSMRTIVCSKCGTNRITGERYVGPGPMGDPTAKWVEV